MIHVCQSCLNSTLSEFVTQPKGPKWVADTRDLANYSGGHLSSMQSLGRHRRLSLFGPFIAPKSIIYFSFSLSPLFLLPANLQEWWSRGGTPLPFRWRCIDKTQTVCLWVGRSDQMRREWMRIHLSSKWPDADPSQKFNALPQAYSVCESSSIKAPGDTCSYCG